MGQIALDIRRESGEVLTYNSKNDTFIYYAYDSRKADELSLPRSRASRGPQGQNVWFTDDPFAALALWDAADGRARDKLQRLKQEFDKSHATTYDGSFPCPEGKSYMPYQRAGIRFGMERGNCLIGDEPGLGKTIEAMGIANAMDARRVLVVCPASIRLNWIREINAWSCIENVKVQAILSGRDPFEAGNHFYVISYELAKSEKFHEALANDYFDLMILDEAHYLKSINSQRTRAVFGGGRGRFQNLKLADAAKQIVALTGTPLPNRPRECYTLARGLDWESIDWLSYEKFCNRYNPSSNWWQKGRKWEAVARLPELRARLRCSFMIRRHKADVLTDLPDKRYEMTYIEPDGAIREVLAKEKLIHFDPDDIFDPRVLIDGAISTVRKEMGIAKIPRAVEHIKFLLDIMEVEKVVVFCHHREVMSGLMEELDDYKPVLRIGGQSSKAQQEAIDTFVTDPDCRVFIGSMDTMEGADGLQHVSQYAVFVENAWHPRGNEQCIDRLHRYGQHGNVIGQFLVVPGSLDEKVLHAVLGKAQNIHRALDGDIK